MSKFLPSLVKKIIGFMAVAALSLGLPLPASADQVIPNMQSFDLTSTPELSFDEMLLMENQICFRITTTGPDDSQYKFKNLVFSGTRVGNGPSEVSFDIPMSTYYSWENQFMICTVDENWESIPELGNPLLYGSVKLSGKSVTNTTFSKSFENQLKTHGLSLSADNPMSVYYNPGNGSQFSVSVENKTKKVVAVKISKFKFEGRSLGSKSFTLIVAPGASDYMNFGSLTEDVSVGYEGADVSATISKVTMAKVTRSTIKVPSGLQLVTTSPADWYYYPTSTDSMPSYSNASYLCQKVKNITKKAISVETKFTFSSKGRKTVAYSGSSVETIPAGETYCLAGAYDNRSNPAGDWRVGSAVNINGSLKVVKASTLSKTGIVLPEGFSVGNSWFSYNAATKKTTVGLVINAPADFQGDLLGSNLTFNGKNGLSSVAGPCQCGGPGVTNIRILNLEPVSGDLRIGKALSLKGTFVTSVPVQLNNSIESDYTQGCYAYFPQEWTYSVSTNKTSVFLRCNNFGTTSKTLDVSSFELTVTIDEESVVYQPIVNSVTLPAKTESKIVVFFLVTGDIRTGGATVDLATALEK
jgi:hypothetical protein